MFRRKKFSSTLPIALSVLPAVLLAQGIPTFKKRTAVIKVLLPPTVNLAHKRIRIDSRVEGKVADSDNLPGLLKTKLVTMIQHDPRFMVDEVKPETVLTFAITNGYIETFTGANSDGSRYSTYRGKMEVSYQAIDTASKRALDSENLSDGIGYEEERRPGLLPNILSGAHTGSLPHSVNETWDRLVDNIVFQMGQRVAPVEQPYDAVLPGKLLDPIATKAINGLWGEVVRDAESYPPFPKPEDDTYRAYLIALGKEAMAYQLAEEANERLQGHLPDVTCEEALAQRHRARTYLYESSQIYKQILQTKTSERVFQDGQMRVSKALTTYDIIERNQPDCAVEAPPPPPASNPMENVLAFCKAKVGMGQIKDYIDSDDFVKDAKGTGFTFQFPKDAIALSKDCGTDASALQTLIRKRLAGGSVAAPPAPKKK
ncbi:MAG TPA: hypothetical protein VHW09_12970 [Bryobacteraceae bacterium]|jgi:hypothetical protein|nr:hypothetical protein [Bryobacteraceae bacterium]